MTIAVQYAGPGDSNAGSFPEPGQQAATPGRVMLNTNERGAVLPARCDDNAALSRENLPSIFNER